MKTNKEIRLECLRLAYQTMNPGEYKDPIPKAEELYEFVIKESVPGKKKK